MAAVVLAMGEFGVVDVIFSCLVEMMRCWPRAQRAGANACVGIVPSLVILGGNMFDSYFPCLYVGVLEITLIYIPVG